MPRRRGVQRVGPRTNRGATGGAARGGGSPGPMSLARARGRRRRGLRTRRRAQHPPSLTQPDGGGRNRLPRGYSNATPTTFAAPASPAAARRRQEAEALTLAFPPRLETKSRGGE